MISGIPTLKKNDQYPQNRTDKYQFYLKYPPTVTLCDSCFCETLFPALRT